MTFKEIQDLLRLINKLELAEFKLKEGDTQLIVRTKEYYKGKQQGPYPAAAPPVLPVTPVSAPYPPAQAPSTAPVTTGGGDKPADTSPSSTNTKEEDTSKYTAIKSPMVGTFYRSSSPDKAAYVKVGDVVEPGSVVCIVEAMKLFNEIESEVSGRIVKVMVEDAQPVEYDQVLFLVDPKA